MEREGEATVSSNGSGSGRSGGGVFLAIMTLVVGLVAGGVIGIFAVGPSVAERLAADRLEIVMGKRSAPEPPRPSPDTPGVFYELDNLIVNPAGSQGTRFLVITLAIEVDGEETASVLDRREAAVRDAVIHILGSKSVVELSDISRREELKEELVETVARVIGSGEVRELYIPQFVIQ